MHPTPILVLASLPFALGALILWLVVKHEYEIYGLRITLARMCECAFLAGLAAGMALAGVFIMVTEG